MTRNIHLSIHISIYLYIHVSIYLIYIFIYKYIYLYLHIHLSGKGTSCKETFHKENVQTGFVIAGGGSLSYSNHQLMKFEEEKRFKLQKQFCNKEKWEMNIFKNFPCKISLCRSMYISICKYIYNIYIYLYIHL